MSRLLAEQPSLDGPESVPRPVPSRRAHTGEHLLTASVAPSGADGQNTHEGAADTGFSHQQLLAHLPHLLWSVDPHGHCDYLSPQWAVFSGRPVSELLGWGWISLLHPEGRRDVTAHWSRLLQTGQPYELELRLQGQDGSYRTFHTQGVPQRGADGRIQRWYGSCQDIQKQVDTSSALAAERQRIQAIADVAPAILHSFRMGPDGRMSFPFGHERIAGVYGMPSEVLRQPSPPLQHFLHEGDRDWLPAALAESARTLTPFRAEYRVLHPTRGVIWIDTHSLPQREADGGTLWQGTMTDITERKQAEQALAESRAQFETVFANLDEGIAVFNPRGQLMYFNPAAYLMHGVPPANDLAVLDDFADLFTVQDLAGRTVPLEGWSMSRILRGEVLAGHEVQVSNLRAGWTRTFSHSGAMVHGDDGQPRFGVLRMSDVTERKRTEAEVLRLNAELEQRVNERTAELQAAVKELEAFTYSVSHDLRSPLRAIDGFSQAVLQDHSDVVPETGRRYLGIIRESAQKMGQLIDDLLAFSRIGRQQPLMRRVQHGMLVRSALQQLEPMCKDRTVNVSVAELPDSLGDPAMLHQVWINLLSNALKYSRNVAQAEVEVGALPAATGDIGPTYFVRDNGAGFDMRFVHKLFAVFERLHRADEFEGTGVGLAIVQRIVQRHGGQVRAEGALGQGATIYFQLQTAESLP